jgi:hypothetical protein
LRLGLGDRWGDVVFHCTLKNAARRSRGCVPKA